MTDGKSSSAAAQSWREYLDRRPAVVAVAGPNGAGKSTFYETHLRPSGLRFVNADALARELDLNPYDAARMAAAVRAELLRQRESFIFETVFSDPAGEKLDFLRRAAASGYSVVLCFIGIASHRVSEERVAMRVTQGGHDVPTEKLVKRFPRVLANLRAALEVLPCVVVFDNDDLRQPFRHLATYMGRKPEILHEPIPPWFRTLLESRAPTQFER